jgi:6-phosphogluconolactonase
MIEVFDDLAALSARAAALFIDTARESVREKGACAVALSGGTTPRLMFQKLVEHEGRDQVPWNKIYVFWGDERHVPLSDPQSNYRMTKETLLDHVPLRHVFPVPFADSAEASAQLYEATLRSHFKTLPRLDLCFLGMGADGHTASLFPGSTALTEKTRWAFASRPLSGGPDRVTLTYPVLNNSRRVCFLVAGADKAATLKQVIENTDASIHYPAQDIRPENGEVIWLLDRAAAADLTSHYNH